MTEGIKIKVITEPDDDKLYHLEISLSNGQTSTRLEFYSYADCFKEFGEQLSGFPKSTTDKVAFKFGEEKEKSRINWACYLLLEVFCFDHLGHSAIKIIADNHSESPNHSRCEFYIKANPASLNDLGQGLKKWNPVDQKVFDWIPGF